jgi:hypothetical protein
MGAKGLLNQQIPQNRVQQQPPFGAGDQLAAVAPHQSGGFQIAQLGFWQIMA